MIRLRRQRIAILLGLCSIVVLVLVIRQIGQWKSATLRNNHEVNNLPRQNREPSTWAPDKPKLILFYTTLWYTQRKWPGFETTEKFNNWHGIPCKVQNCEVTYDRDRAGEADVILFHVFSDDMISKKEIDKLLTKARHVNQIWIYFVHESPYNAKPRPYNYNGLFNWTMGYMRHADIYVPYNWESGNWQKSELIPSDMDYSKGKDKTVYAMVSHCGLLRDKYIKKLQEYIPVDVYGKCSKDFHTVPKVCKRNSQECEKKKKQYKFYLAFENSFCTDYVTEKLHKTILDANAVPVVLGGADYSYRKNAIPNSYIDVLDFKTIKDLADHLKYLDTNNEAYNNYQSWRKSYKLGKPKAWSCEICRMINEKPLLRKSYQNLGNWYGIKENCGKRIGELKAVFQNSNVPGPYEDEFSDRQ